MKIGRPTLREGEPSRHLTLRLPESVARDLPEPRSRWLRAAIEFWRARRVWLLWDGSDVVSVHATRRDAREAGLLLKAQGAAPEIEARDLD